MTNTANGAPPWGSAPTTKAKSAAHRSVTALLDELAPERVLKRIEEIPGPVEQHRTPTGCVLQAADCAVSVSWFPDPTKDSALGELHVLVWQGKVARRGVPPSSRKAVVVSQLILSPIEEPVDDSRWQATDGARYTTASLAAKCIALLEAQMIRTEAPKTS